MEAGTLGMVFMGLGLLRALPPARNTCSECSGHGCPECAGIERWRAKAADLKRIADARDPQDAHDIARFDGESPAAHTFGAEA